MIKNILFICTGNTCRSAMAKGIADRLIKNNGLDLCAESRGLFASDGEPASLNAVQTLKEKSIDISTHRAQSFTENDGKKADIILVMTKSHLKNINQEFPAFKDKTFLLSDKEITDPFGGSLNVYKISAEQIEHAVKILLDKIKNENQKS